MVKVIVFDLGNVIIPFDFCRFYRKIAQHCNYSPAEIASMELGKELAEEFECGRISSREFFQTVRERLQSAFTYECFIEIWNDIFTENLAVSALVRHLKKSYRLFLLSNTNELHFNHARRTYPVLGLFEEYILSYRMGCMKPDPLLFQEVLKRAGCRGEEIIYTDDVEEYTKAAGDWGIKAIHFRSPEQLEKELGAILPLISLKHARS